MEEFFKLPFEKRKMNSRNKRFQYFKQVAVPINDNTGPNPLIMLSSFKWQFERYHNFQLSIFNFQLFCMQLYRKGG